MLVDGIKVVSDDGWALVVPDPEDPVTHVWAEGADLAGVGGAGGGLRARRLQPGCCPSGPIAGVGSGRVR